MVNSRLRSTRLMLSRSDENDSYSSVIVFGSNQYAKELRTFLFILSTFLVVFDNSTDAVESIASSRNTSPPHCEFRGPAVPQAFESPARW